MTRQTIEQIAIADLRPWAKNARTHSKKQLRQIADSIETFGFTNPVLIDGANTILAGHGRVAAAKLIEMAQVIADAIRDVSGRGEIVLDLFGGSGSTLIAAAKTGRRGHLCELDPIYCDRILARWEGYARDEAKQLVCGWPRVVARREAAE
jgi:hypothetical protein